MLLDADYFNDDATHSLKEFWRRFRMNKELFLKIVHGVREYDKYFTAKQDCTGLWSFTSIQKYTTTMSCLAYGAPADTSNDYLLMAESTWTETLYRFFRAIIAVFAKDYLRAPREDDTTQILQKMQQEDFLGCSEALVVCIGAGRIALFLGRGSTRGILRSPVFAKLAEGQAPFVNFEMEAYFATCQEVAREDVERTFGVLQQRFAIVRVMFFGWLLTQSRIHAHHDVLRKTIVNVAGAGCPLCDDPLETASHMAFHCLAAACLWAAVGVTVPPDAHWNPDGAPSYSTM
ncbi:uncharacterized protein [Lolium perenne]|uniref:uncharacterized protein n=1 Tax=Lolium perenne TaxID=4522 RepID=UPI0021F55CD2|nr:uncharacterized protein LOC127329202 [Lolium perenne]